VFPVAHSSAQDFMLSLASWAHANKNSKQSVLLLVDDLEGLARLDFDALQNFRWLLARGPTRRVWPIITMNAERYGQVLAWIPIFRTRIFGRIRNERVAEVLSSDRPPLGGARGAGPVLPARERKMGQILAPGFLVV
jgi:hypothetical protein